MEIVILVVHIILALSIIGIVLLQPPENSSLGGLGGSNPMAMGTRGQGNLLTHTTAILAGLFIVTSLVLAIISGVKPAHKSILDEPPIIGSEKNAPTAPAAPPKTPALAEPLSTTPETPAVPLAK